MTPISAEEYRALRDLLHRVTGIALAEGKAELLRSRLQKRLRAHGLASYGAYHELLVHRDPDGAELREMVNAMTTNKTSFFREPYQFDWLRRELVPALKERARTGGPRRLRVWSAGCSTGAEPYTIAMLMRESFEADWDLSILATDIDTQVLAIAEAGEYEGTQLEGLDERVLGRHFVRARSGDRVTVRPELRSLITFRQLNLIEPFTVRGPFDLIFCRNVSIYFDRPTQIDVFGRLASQLAPGGHLLVGHSESLADMGLPLTPMRGNMHRKIDAAAPAFDRSRPAAAHAQVAPGSIETARAPTELVAHLAQTTAVCLFDAAAPIGGLAHLPDALAAGPSGALTLRRLVDQLRGLGAMLPRVQAKVIASSEAAFAGVQSALTSLGVPLVQHRLVARTAHVRFLPAQGRVCLSSHRGAA